MAIRKNITGQKYHQLTALEPIRKDKNGVWYWLFHCDCGNEKIIRQNAVVSGSTKSCSCQQGFTKHGFKRGLKYRDPLIYKFYRAWQSMRERCQNPKFVGFKNYGGRGIKVYQRWQNFENFKMDMFETFSVHFKKYGPVNTSLDRIQVNGNYQKSNCRWATKKEQANNTRRIL